MALSPRWSRRGRAAAPYAAALALHLALATGLWLVPRPEPRATPDDMFTPVELVFLPPPPEPESSETLEEPAESDAADASDSPAFEIPDLAAPPVILQSDRAPATAEERDRALPPVSENTRRVLQALAGCLRPDGTRRAECFVTGALQPSGDANIAVGLAGLSAAEIRALFGGAPLMPKAPDEPIDGARDRRLSGSSEMRERLPPAHADPVFGD